MKAVGKRTRVQEQQLRVIAHADLVRHTARRKLDVWREWIESNAVIEIVIEITMVNILLILKSTRLPIALNFSPSRLYLIALNRQSFGEKEM